MRIAHPGDVLVLHAGNCEGKVVIDATVARIAAGAGCPPKSAG
jgi:hypothetical protein